MNNAGLPIDKLIKYDNGVENRTYWYYSVITSTQEPLYDRPSVPECRIIRQLDPSARYYNMSAAEVTLPASTQLLLEANKECVNRVLFVSDTP